MDKRWNDIILEELPCLEKVAKRIVFSLWNPSALAEHKCICIPFMNLVIMFSVLYEGERENQQFMVSEQMLKVWNISLEQLWSIAYANTQRLRPLEDNSLHTILREIAKQNMGEHYDQELIECLLEEGGTELHVLTNKEGAFGASSLLYEDAVKSCSDALGSDLLLLPSSVHEWLYYKYDTTIPIPELCQMVQEINRAEVQEKDRLADTVYIYHREEDTLECVETGEKWGLGFEAVKNLLTASGKVA